MKCNRLLVAMVTVAGVLLNFGDIQAQESQENQTGTSRPAQFKLPNFAKGAPAELSNVLRPASGEQASRVAARVDETASRATPGNFPESLSAKTLETKFPAFENRSGLIQLPQESPAPVSKNVRRQLLEPVTTIQIDLSHAGKKIPDDRSSEVFGRTGFEWEALIGEQLCFYWDAPNIRYRKLYFEDVAVERYGQVPCGCWQQTGRVAAHWAVSLLTVPLKMRLDPYYDCDTPLGLCRPGECVSPIFQRPVYR